MTRYASLGHDGLAAPAAVVADPSAFTQYDEDWSGSVDVSGSTFQVAGGLIWTLEKGTAAFSSTATGIAFIPNASGKAMAWTALSGAFGASFADLDLILLWRRTAATKITGGTPASTKYRTLEPRVGTPTTFATYAGFGACYNGATPSGDSIQAPYSGGSTIKASPAVDTTTIRWVGVRLQGGAVAQGVYATVADPAVADLTYYGRYANLLAPNGTAWATAMQIEVNRGSEAFQEEVDRFRSWKRPAS